MSQGTLRISVLAMLLVFIGGASAQADEVFTVRIENVSAKDALKLSNGKTERVAVAPVLYVIHTNRAPLFTSGEPDRGKGLEALAEDGPTGPLAESLKGPSRLHSRANLRSAARSALVIDRSLEHRTYCKVAIIWDHPPLDASRVKCGQPRRNFAV